MNQTINVMLVEDHPEYREVIEMALQYQPDIALVSQVGSAERALRGIEDRTLGEQPDVILLDLNLPGKSGLEAIPTFRHTIPDAKIIILTQSDQEADVLSAIREGAVGYLLKSSSIEEIVDGIRTVANGTAILGSGIANFILDSVKARHAKDKLEHPLSERELEILELLGQGLLKKEVAKQLDIRIPTVNTYIRRIYEKMDVQNAPSAISKAYRMGIFPTEKKD